MPKVIRLRQSTPAQLQRLETLRKVSQLLDSAFVIPGTSYRIGLDPIMGLVPVIGDLIPPLFTIGILWQARDFGVPRVVQMRMIFNVAIDAVLGMVPVVGDLFDFGWKATAWNLALLEKHAMPGQRATSGDYLFVTLCSAVIVIAAVLPLLVLWWGLSWVAAALNALR